MTVTPSWEALLDAPGACDHVVQLYTDDDFRARAVGRFVAAGLAAGEAVVAVATPAHLALFADRLPEARAALARGQLIAVDAPAMLRPLMVGGMPDPAIFHRAVTDILDRVRTAGYSRMRLYGEMVNLLWQDGAVEAAVRLEELWNAVLAEQSFPVLCAYRIDPFDRHAHRTALTPIGGVHSHLIPVDDYERLDRAVDRAYTDVFGHDGDAEILRDLLVAALAPVPVMPRAQAALLALRDVSGDTADAVLERAKEYYAKGG